MKKILYLSFYFEPDLSAGAFRNTSLVKELAKQVDGKAEVVLLTTKPNRYSTFKAEAKSTELIGNLTIHRIEIPAHKSGFLDQIISFRKYFSEVKRMTKKDKFDLVIASSSRLFTAYLGFIISKRNASPLYLDIRDIFVDTLKDVLKNSIIRLITLTVIRFVEKRTFSNLVSNSCISVIIWENCTTGFVTQINCQSVYFLASFNEVIIFFRGSALPIINMIF